MSVEKIEEKIDFIISSFLRKVRGKVSQTEYARQLGYNFNIVNRWELGNKKFMWNDFVQICKHEEIDLFSILFDLTGIKFDKGYDGRIVSSEIFNTLLKRENSSKYFSLQKIRRLSSDKSKLTFQDFIVMIELTSGRSMRFLESILDKSDFELIFPDAPVQYNQLIREKPALSIIRMVLGLKGYRELEKHSSEYISKLTGIEVQNIDLMIAVLEKIGMIKWDKNHFLVVPGYVDARLNHRDSTRRIIEYWREQIATYTKTSDEEANSKLLSAYLIYGTNAEIDRKVFELTNKYYTELRNLLLSHEEDDHSSLKLINIDLFCPLSNHRELEE